MPREIDWTDTMEIGIQLQEMFPDTDPYSAQDLGGEFAASDCQDDEGGEQPGEGASGDGDDVAEVGRDRAEGVGQAVGGDERDDGRDQGAEEFGELQVGEQDQAFAVEQDGERGCLDSDAGV